MSPAPLWPESCDEDGASSPETSLASSIYTATTASLSRETVHLQARDAFDQGKVIKKGQRNPYKLLQIYHRPGELPLEAFSLELEECENSWVTTTLAARLKVRLELIDPAVTEKVGSVRLQSLGTVNLQVIPQECPRILPSHRFHITENPEGPDMILGSEILKHIKVYRAQDRKLRPRRRKSTGAKPEERPNLLDVTGMLHRFPSDPGPKAAPMMRGSSSKTAFFSANQHRTPSLSSQGLEAITENIEPPQRIRSWASENPWIVAHIALWRALVCLWRGLLIFIAFSLFYDHFLNHHLPFAHALAFIFQFGDAFWAGHHTPWILKGLQIIVFVVGLVFLWTRAPYR